MKGGGEQQRPLKKKNVFLILEGKLLLAARRKPVYCPDLHGFDLEGTSRTCTLVCFVRDDLDGLNQSTTGLL